MPLRLPCPRPARLLRRLAVALAMAVPQLAAAQGLPDNVVRGSILPGWRTPEGTQMAALRLVLADGWKTYWRAPGEAGIPPRFNWAGSQNLGAVALHWPAPVVFDQNGYRSIGYKHELVLPIEITPRNPGQPVRLQAALELGVCRDICLPVTLQLAGALPVDGAPDPVIRAALAAQPVAGRKAGIGPASCSVQPTRDGLRLTTTVEVPPAPGEEVAVIETADPTLWVSEADTRREGNRLVASADLVPAVPGPVLLDRSQTVLTLIRQTGAIEIRGCNG